MELEGPKVRLEDRPRPSLTGYNRTGPIPSLMVLILGHSLVRLHEMYFKTFKIIQNAIISKNTLKHIFV